MAAAIDFYFDFISPYGYLASTQVDGVAARHDRSVNWRPFLMGVPILKVMGLKPLMQTPLKSDYTLRDVLRLAEWLDVPLAMPHVGATNSRAATRAFYWIHDRCPTGAVSFARGVYERMWVRGENICDSLVLIDVAAGLGVVGDEFEAAMTSDEGKSRVEREVAAAIARGIFGSPFFVADGELFWGVDRLPMLERWLESGDWSARAGRQFLPGSPMLKALGQAVTTGDE